MWLLRVTPFLEEFFLEGILVYCIEITFLMKYDFTFVQQLTYLKTDQKCKYFLREESQIIDKTYTYLTKAILTYYFYKMSKKFYKGTFKVGILKQLVCYSGVVTLFTTN